MLRVSPVLALILFAASPAAAQESAAAPSAAPSVDSLLAAAARAGPEASKTPTQSPTPSAGVQEPPAAPPPAAAGPSTSVIPGPVAVATLAAPDAFSTAGRDTGLPATLWRGTSLPLARAVLPLLADHPLPPVAAALARRVLATGAPGPQGAGSDPALAAGRARALIVQGDPRAAAVILARAPALDRNADLARVAAESALLAGDDSGACAIEQALTADRGDVYWLRLRTYCQAIAGKTREAQLTFDLAQSQAHDAVFGRLMSAKLAAAGDPGAPSLRNGLDLALSRSLGLDLSQAKPSPEVAAALAAGAPAEPSFDFSEAPPELAGVIGALTGSGPLPAMEIERLLDAADSHDPKARARAQGAALLAAAYAEPLGPSLRARVAALPLPAAHGSVGRLMVMDDAAAAKRMGETALLVLWACADAGHAGLDLGERAEIVRALRRVGLDRDARAFALEGLADLK